MVVEVMGRYAGWIALHAGIGGGADVISFPRFRTTSRRWPSASRERDSWGAHFSIVVVAEGAKPAERARVADAKPAVSAGLNGSAASGHRVAAALEQLTGKETRTWCSAISSAADHPRASIACWRRGSAAKAVELILRGEFGRMVA